MQVFEGIDIKVIRSDRKTISIYVERDGSVSVLAPKKLTEVELQKVIKSKEYLISKYLAEWQQLNDGQIAREYVNGQSFLYLGRNYRLEIIKNQEEPLILKNGYFLLSEIEKEKAREHFISFYKEKVRPRIEKRVELYKTYLGVNPNKIRVMELKNRWASCTTNGNLNFHWKCAMAPADVLDYIIIHELAHLIHKNHTKAFWNEIDKVIPDYSNRLQWLTRNGAGMDL